MDEVQTTKNRPAPGGRLAPSDRLDGAFLGTSSGASGAFSDAPDEAFCSTTDRAIPAFELQGVSLYYPWNKKPALKNVSLVVPQNAICGLFGRNAAGKTSLMALLAAFRRPSSGTVRVFGKNPYENPHVARQTAFIYNSNRTDDFASQLRVKKHLELARHSRPLWDEGFAVHLCERFNLPLKKYQSKLSLGQRAALRCVIGLASRTPLTIFDEAYLGMDAIYRRIFVDELLADYLRVPRTILFSTHYIAEMERIFSEAIILDDGIVLAQGEADALRASGNSGANSSCCDGATAALDNDGGASLDSGESASLQDVFIRLAIKEGEVYDPAEL